MRTTLTIDPDIAAELQRLRRERRLGLKALINDALRRGLQDIGRPGNKRKPFRTRSMDLGRCLIDNIDNIAEVLAIAEGEDYR